MPKYRRLTSAQEQQFLRDGFVVVPGALPRDFCEENVRKVFNHLDLPMDDPSAWTQPRLHLPNLDTFLWRERAPVAFDIICDLLGEDRIDPDVFFGNGMIVNFNIGADRPWQPPSPAVGGWHKDGNFFRHFLDSPEQGLLSIVVWRDIGPQGGGTFFAPDSVGHIARFLVQHPEGVGPGGFPMQELINACSDFREVLAKAGDIVFLHPYMLHAGSQNPSGIARFITNPPVSLLEPMQFNRLDPADFSLLERSILGHLGVERLDWRITAEREHYTPGHLKAYEDFKAGQKAG